jgi:transcriptional regulator with XRE-family HTH domain
MDREVGRLIREARTRLGMTQAEAAYAIGVTVSTLNRWENGHHIPRIKPVRNRILEVLGVDVAKQM